MSRHSAKAFRFSLRRPALAGLLAGPVWAFAAPDGVTEYALASGEDYAHSPVVRSEAGRVTAAWIEGAEGQPEVLRGAVLQESDAPPALLLLDDGSAGLPLQPDAAINPATGQPAWLWVRAGDTEHAVLFSDGAQTTTVVAGAEILELPVLEIDLSGNMYAVWTQVNGGESRLAAAVRPAGEPDWTPLALSTGERPYDVLPQVFTEESEAIVYWYSIGNEVTSRAAVLDPGGLPPSEVPAPTLAPPNRIPTLYRITPEQELGAIWVEQFDLGELYFDLDPRTAGENCIRVLADGEDTRLAPVVSRDAQGVKAWLEADGGLVLETDPEARMRLSVEDTTSGIAVAGDEDAVYALLVDDAPGPNPPAARLWTIPLPRP